MDGLPALPPEYADVVHDGLAQLDLELDAAARSAIDGHLRLLLAWTTAVNLTAIRDPVTAATLHVLDSLAAVRLVRRLGADRLVDLGSGGGYPGLPLAVATPARALLVESIGKKARFLRTTIDALGIADRVEVAVARAEALAGDPTHRERWPLATARALAPLDELVELAFPLLAIGGSLIAWKRGDLGRELAAARRAAAALGSGTLTVEAIDVAGLADHRLVTVTKLGPTPAAYPRDPAARDRRPW